MTEILGAIVSAEEGTAPTQLYFKFLDQCCRCVVIRKAATGAMVCIPMGGIDVGHFQLAEEKGYPDALGPFMETAVVAATPLGKASKRFLEVLIFDLDNSGIDCLLTSKPEEFSDDQVTVFGVFRGLIEWPFPSALLEMAQQFVALGGERLEAYETAAEEVPGGDPGPLPNGAGQDMHALLDQLLSQAEVTQRTVNGMKDQFSLLQQLDARLQRVEKKGSAPTGRAASAAAAPQLFNPQASPLGEDAQDRLRELASRGPGRMGDLGTNASQVPRGRSSAVVAANDGTIEDVVADEEDLDGEPLENPNTLEKLLASQSKILERLVLKTTLQNDPLSILGSGPPDSEDAPKTSGVKGIAARQVLMDSFKKHPDKVVSLFKERLALARRKGSARELEARDLWMHFQETVPLGSHRTLTYLAFLSAEMFEAMERKNFGRLQMLVVLQACFIEQAAHDGGALKLAHLLTCLEEPPWGLTEMRKTVRSEFSHGQLSDPRWIATHLAFLRDIDSIQEKSTKLPKPAARSEDSTNTTAEPKKTPKWKPRKKRVTLEAAEDEG
eukprot:Skav213560  [mRNA]  locus=scaffold263:152241:153902:+ [translate_table: standard]